MESLHARPGGRRAVCQVAAKHSAPASADTPLMSQHQRAEQQDEPCSLCTALNLTSCLSCSSDHWCSPLVSLCRHLCGVWPQHLALRRRTTSTTCAPHQP